MPISGDRQAFLAHHEEASEGQGGSEYNQRARFGAVRHEGGGIGNTRRTLDGENARPIGRGVAGDEDLGRHLSGVQIEAWHGLSGQMEQPTR